MRQLRQPIKCRCGCPSDQPASCYPPTAIRIRSRGPWRLGCHLSTRAFVSALISNPSAASAAERERLLGVSVLLRQPHGFEGVLLLLIHDHPLDCSVADCPYKG